MALQRRSRHLARSQKRESVWDAGPNLVIAAISATGKTLWTNGRVLATESKATIVRIRGVMTFQLDLATAAGNGLSGAVGIGLVSQEAFAAGVASIPGPFDQPEWKGWMWHHYFSIRGVAAQSAGADVARNVSADLRLEIDSKAMRKMGSNETLFGIIDVEAEDGTASMAVVADTRVLFKLT